MMHLFTITIHSDLFGETVDDLTLESMAYECLNEAERLLVKHQLSDSFNIEAYWGRGSLIEHFMLILNDANLLAMFSTGVMYKTIKDYKLLKENVMLMASDLKNFRATVSGKKIIIRVSLVSETKPTRGTKRIKHNPAKKDE